MYPQINWKTSGGEFWLQLQSDFGLSIPLPCVVSTLSDNLKYFIDKIKLLDGIPYFPFTARIVLPLVIGFL